ncbi:MAG: biotin carboxylase N-terminal domain-containing protein, partial [Pseudomonadota bacterium]
MSASQEVTLHKRVLISNRGEIAIRIAKAAANLGLESVSIYAPVDSMGLHTRSTTESHEIGAPGEAVSAYLDIEAVIKVAKDAGCDCVHPGYGFLSENARFAERCAEEGIKFIGPHPSALSLFGDKVRARTLAQSLDIPVVPGSKDPLNSAEEATSLANELGYPVMLKASAGGGGRGMRAVDKAEDMAEAFERCRSEAESAFGDGSVFVEKLVMRPRHIE